MNGSIITANNNEIINIIFIYFFLDFKYNTNENIVNKMSKINNLIIENIRGLRSISIFFL